MTMSEWELPGQVSERPREGRQKSRREALPMHIIDLTLGHADGEEPGADPRLGGIAIVLVLVSMSRETQPLPL